MIQQTIQLTVAILLVCQPAAAQPTNGDSLGLELAWRFQAPTDTARMGPLHVTPHVSASRKRIVYQVSYQGGPTIVFTAGQLDRGGKVLDDARAARLADIELRTLKAFGHEDASIATREVPHVSMLVQTGGGRLLLLDGETGLLEWSIDIGRYDLTSQPPAIGERHVAAIKGSMLYIINVDNGQLEQEHQLRGIPDAGPTITGQHVMVPRMQGPIELYSLKEGELRRPPTFKASYGRITSPALVTPQSITWATDRGFLFLADPQAVTPTSRIEVRQGIVGAPAFIPPELMVVAVEDGYVVAVDLQRRQIQWEFFTGESLTESPYALDGVVYVPTAQNDLFAVNSQDGSLKWTSRGISRVLTGLNDQLFCQATDGQLVAVDTTSGQVTAAMATELGDSLLANRLTDRVYVVRRSGMIESWHAKQAPWPTIHLPLPEVVEAGDEPAADGEPTETTTTEKGSPAADSGQDEDNPFAQDMAATPDDTEDPMAADSGDVDMSEEPDPFGGSEDENPFGTSEDEDPFGAGSDEDPFG